MIGMCRTVASPWIAFCVTSPDGLRPRPRRWNYRPPPACTAGGCQDHYVLGRSADCVTRFPLMGDEDLEVFAIGWWRGFIEISEVGWRFDGCAVSPRRAARQR